MENAAGSKRTQDYIYIYIYTHTHTHTNVILKRVILMWIKYRCRMLQGRTVHKTVCGVWGVGVGGCMGVYIHTYIHIYINIFIYLFIYLFISLMAPSYLANNNKNYNVNLVLNSTRIAKATHVYH